MPLPESAILTPIKESDLDLVLEWRNSDRIRANMFSDYLISMEEHKAWFDKSKNEEKATFFIFHFQKKPVGIFSVSQWNKESNTCNWGFYIGEPDVPKGCGTLLGYLGMEYIFNSLKVRKVCGEVFAFNTASIRFHEKFGFVREGYFKEHILKNGKYEDVLFFSLFQEQWGEIKSKIEKQSYSDIAK
jgi:UDP-4-amino-4,6-dideoxy-N-acetyl-beta-L-altrosamine N-acetyltransferase